MFGGARRKGSRHSPSHHHDTRRPGDDNAKSDRPGVACRATEARASSRIDSSVGSVLSGDTRQSIVLARERLRTRNQSCQPGECRCPAVPGSPLVQISEDAPSRPVLRVGCDCSAASGTAVATVHQRGRDARQVDPDTPGRLTENENENENVQ
jgi:hypothetical protein